MRPRGIPKNLPEFEVHGTTEPFIAIDPLEGLTAWGPYDAPKKIVGWWIDDDGAKAFLVEIMGEMRIVRCLLNEK